MNKALVIGCPGSGKSVFSRALGALSGLSVVHLDNLYWKKDGSHLPRAAFEALLEEALARPRWIIDGDYSRTLARRLDACDTVFFLDYDVETCLAGVTARKGQPRSDMAWIEPDALDPDFLALIRNYPFAGRLQVLEELGRLNGKDIIVFRNRDEAAAWLAAYQDTKEAENKN